MITLKKIAELADVSRGTVDKVIHGRPGVSEETRKKVKALLSENNYEPHMAGRLLAKQKREFTAAAVYVFDKNDEYFHMVKKGMDAAYKEIHQPGFRLRYEIIERNSEEIIYAKLISLAREGVNVIILPPYNSEKVRALIGELTSKGIYTVTYSTDILDSSRLFFVGNDYYKSGFAAASLMAKLLDYSGDIFFFDGDAGVKCHQDRKEGFLDYFSEHCPCVRITERHVSSENQLEMFFFANGIFKNHSGTDGIFIVSRGVDGIIAAVKEQNWLKRPKIVTFDIYSETLRHLKSGDIDFVVDQNPVEQGRLIINTLFEFIFYGRAIKNDNLYTPMTIYIKENVS